MIDSHDQPRMPRAARAFAFLVIGALFAVSVAAATVAQQAGAVPAADPSASNLPTGSNQTAILITMVFGFLSMLATHAFQFYRENRNRKWDLQDREAARKEVRQHAETQRLETIQTAIELARVSNINRQHLSAAIEKNTDITAEAGTKADAAYVAAESFKSQLSDLHAELQKLAATTTDKGSKKAEA